MFERDGRARSRRFRARRIPAGLLRICLFAGWLAGCGNPHGSGAGTSVGPGSPGAGTRVVHLFHQGDFSAAEALLESWDAEEAAPSDTVGTGADAVRLLLCRAVLLEREEDLAGSEQLLASALDRLKAVPGETGRRTFFILMHRAGLLQAMGRIREADACVSEAMRLARGMKDRGRRLEALAFREKEKLLRASGGYEKELRRAIRRHETLLGPDHPYVARGLYHLGILMEEQGRTLEAERYYLRSMEAHKKLLGPTHPVIATFLNHLASLHRKNGTYKKAKIYLTQMVAIYEENFRRTDPQKLDALKTMVLRTQVDVTPVIRDLIRFEEKQVGPDHPDLAQSLRYYAMVLESKQQYEEAESMLRRALRIYEKNYPPEHPHLIFARKRLAQCLFSRGKAEEAVTWTEQTLAIERQAYGDRPSALLPTVYTLALYLHGAGRFPEAEQAYRRVLEYYENREDGEERFLREITGKLVEVLRAQEKEEAAETLQKRLQERKRSRQGVRAVPSSCPRRGKDTYPVDF